MRLVTLACVTCILLGALQLAISVVVLGDGATATFQLFFVPGTIAVLVGVSGIAMHRKYGDNRGGDVKGRSIIDGAISVLALAVGILTILLAFYSTRGYGSV